MAATEVTIIGAGVAGLSAALALKARGISYTLLEATATIGGRAQTHLFPSGVAADLGPHWLHAQESELGNFVSAQNLQGRDDKSTDMRVYQGGQYHLLRDDLIEQGINQAKAKPILLGKASDLPMSDLGRNETLRKTLRLFGQGWNGLQAPIESSAYEFLTDESKPGGFQLAGGIASLTSALTKAVGRDTIRLNRPIKSVTMVGGYVIIDGERVERAIITASLGVLRSGALKLDPDMAEDIGKATEGLLVSHVNKIILELTPDFFDSRKIPADLNLQMLDGHPHYCHVRAAGTPVISLFVTGDRAHVSEAFSAVEAIAYVKQILAPVDELKGFDRFLVSEPIITKWMSNPYARGAYSALFPGYRRPDPFWNWCRRIGVCGDSFDDRFPGSLAGAFRSGQRLVGRLPGLGLR